MITLYLARHGQTVENIGRIFQGHLPGTLTEEGIQQAKDLRDELKDETFDYAVCSDLKRAVDTMDILTEGHDMKFQKTPLLREIDWGSWTGMKIKDVDLSNMPADVETEAMLYERGGKIVEFLKENFTGKVLVVGHGMINRSIQANIEGVPLSEIRSVKKMNNCEIRQFVI